MKFSIMRLSGTIAYAVDVVIIACGKFLPTLSELIEHAINTLLRWAKSCGLGTNPQKTELVLFTNKRVIPSFALPVIEGITLTLKESAKYLGVILDRKLNWKQNIEERTRKAACALYLCNRIYEKKWGPNPRTILWMYTAIIRPILTYGSVRLGYVDVADCCVRGQQPHLGQFRPIMLPRGSIQLFRKPLRAFYKAEKMTDFSVA